MDCEKLKPFKRGMNQCLVVKDLCGKDTYFLNYSPCSKCQIESSGILPTVLNPTLPILDMCGLTKHEEPGIFQKALSYGEALIAHARGGFKEVSEEVYQSRLEICKGCDHYNSEDNKCKACGCKLSGGAAVESKLRMSHESCPLSKWGPDNG